MRALAIALVIAQHLYGRPVGGVLGVDLFFVLSGFLITTLLLEEWRRFGSISLKLFYARRALRLWPALLAMLGVTLLLMTVGAAAGHEMAMPLNSESLKQIGYGVTYTTNFAVIWGHVTRPDTQHLWSLAVEEQFYLVWPFILLVCLRLRRRPALAGWVAVAIAIFVALARVALAPKHPSGLDPGFVTRFDPILAGCGMAVLCSSGWGERVRRASARALWIPATIALVVVVWMANGNVIYDGLSDLFAVAAAILIVGALDTQSVPGRVLSIAPLVFIGRISYALYLWHLPVNVWASRSHFLSHAGSTVGRPSVIVVSVALAVGSYYLVERPFLRRKWRLARVASHDVPLDAAVSDPAGAPTVRPSV